MVGLLIDRYKFPLDIGCFEGSKAETSTIIPIIRAFEERHDLEGFILDVSSPVP